LKNYLYILGLLWWIGGLPTLVKAQTPEENLEKYWNYRERLVGTKGQAGFVSVGLEQGCSVPASERYPVADCQYDWYLNHNNCDKHQGKGRLHWGDGTVYLGYYIAVLALEYANLERAKQSTDAVAQELWYALLAVERLDSLAEVVLGHEGKLDGFFLRDDVPADFYYQEAAPHQRRFGTDSFQIDCLSSDYVCGEFDVKKGGFISQDQVLSLFVGFMAIHQLIKDRRYQDTLPTFGEKVAVITHRIANYMMTNKWKLKGPSGEKIPDKWGGNAIGFSFPIATIANDLTDDTFKDDYLRKGAGGGGLIVFDLLQITLPIQNEMNVGMTLVSQVLMGQMRNRLVCRIAIKNDRAMYGLMHAVYFDKKLSKKLKKADLEQFLNTAPFDGPCFNTPNCKAPDGWKSYDRWVHPAFKNGNPYGKHSQTAGLDYMLLYNLYHYYYQKELPSYQYKAPNGE